MRLIVIITFLFIYTSLEVLGQIEKENLTKELNKTNIDTTRIRILLQLSDITSEDKPKEALKYATEALILAKKLDITSSSAEAYLQLAYSYQYMNEFGKSDTNSLKAKQLFEEYYNPQGISRAINIIAMNALNKMEYPKAIEFYNQSIVFAEKANYQKGLSGIYSNLGLIYDFVDNLDKALTYYQMAYNIDSAINNKEGIAFTYNNMGRLYAKKGENDKALLYYTKSFDIFSQMNNHHYMAYLLGNIGNMYFEINNFNKALEYYHNSIKIKTKIGDKVGIANTLSNIGAVYIKLSLDSALIYFKTAQNLYEQANHKTGIANSFGNIGEVYAMQGKTKEAINYLNKSIVLKMAISDLNGIAKNYLALGNIYYSNHQLEMALEHFKKSLNYADISSDKKTRLACLKQIAETQASKKNFIKAYETYKLYLLCYDSISNEQAKKDLLDIQIKYETNNKDKEITLLNNENKTKIQKIKNQRYLILASILFILIVTIFAIIYYKLFQKNKRTNLILIEQNNKIKFQKEEITKQRDSLENLNTELEKQKKYIIQQHAIIEQELKSTLLKSEILQRENLSFQLETLKNQLNPHFLFNTFSTLISLIPENATLAEKYTRHLSNVYRYILTSKDKELVKLSDELEFVNSYMFLVSIRFDNSVKVEIKVENEQLSKYLPLLSLQLLIENAVKHNIISNKKNLFITIEANKDMLTVSNNLQKKSSVENSTNIGLQNIANRYRLISKRKIEIIQNPNEFIVKLPLLNENSST